jgi:hypothetical protein
LTYEEITYEGYGRGGAALIVETLTDNKNRTVGELRHLLEKHHGNLGSSNSVAWMFEKKGYIVVEKGKVVGYAHIGMGSVGLQIGVQEFSQIVFFKDAAALARFKQNKFEFSANASAVIVKTGGADAADYREGVAVFVKPTGGAMAELSLGTQKFNYKPDAK